MKPVPKQIGSRQTLNAPPPPPPPVLVIQSIAAAAKKQIEKEIVSPSLDESLFNGPNPFSKLLMSPPSSVSNNNEILDLLAASYRNIP